MLQEGTAAPSFELPDHRGGTVSLEDLRGRWVVLWWFVQADTPGWRMEGQGFRDRAPEFEALDAEVLGASFDPPEANQAFAEKFQLPFKLLSDSDRSVGARYEVRRGPDEKYASTPRRTTYLIDPEGVIRRAYRVKDIEPHPGEVLEDLRRLRVG